MKTQVISDRTFNAIASAVEKDTLTEVITESFEAVLSSVERYTDSFSGKPAAKLKFLSVKNGTQLMSLKTNLLSFIDSSEKAVAEGRVFGVFQLQAYPKGHSFKGDQKTTKSMIRVVDTALYKAEDWKAITAMQEA